MDPITMFAMALGSGLNAAGKLGGAFGSANTEELSASVKKSNALLLKDQADTLLTTGSQNADTRASFDQYRVGHGLDHVLSKQRAYFANDHLDPNAASPMLLAASSIAQSELDLGLIRARAVSEKADVATRGADIYGKAAGQWGDANALTAKAASDRIAGYFGAATALLAPAAKWPGLSGGGGGGGDSNAFFPSESFLDHGFGFDGGPGTAAYAMGPR